MSITLPTQLNIKRVTLATGCHWLWCTCDMADVMPVMLWPVLHQSNICHPCAACAWSRDNRCLIRVTGHTAICYRHNQWSNHHKTRAHICHNCCARGACCGVHHIIVTMVSDYKHVPGVSSYLKCFVLFSAGHCPLVWVWPCIRYVMVWCRV